MDKEAIRRKIEEIEQQLSELKLSLLEEDKQERTPSSRREIVIGDKVIIKNAKPGQEKRGVVTKINQESGFVTVQTETQFIRRLRKNLRKLQE